MFNNVNEFVAALNNAFKAHAETAVKEITFEVRAGRKFDKVMVTSYGQCSVYCFVDRLGNVYKAAGINTPAKGVRATLATLRPDFADFIALTGYASTGWLYR